MIKKGDRFSRLKVISFAGRDRSSAAIWLCICDCGKTKEIAQSSLKTGNTKSCGCLQKEAVSRAFKKHGMIDTCEYRTWNAMKQRCSNPRHDHFHHYGGRGIRVCKRWLNSFENFIADMGAKPSLSHTIDRIDNDGNYEPSNCRWATQSEQLLNRRCRLFTHRGKTMNLREWSAFLGVRLATLRTRVSRGYSVSQILCSKVATHSDAANKMWKNQRDGNGER